MIFLVQMLVPIGVILGFCIAITFTMPQSSGEWASWAQAFGSFAAIWGAYWVGTRQARAAAETVEADRRLVRSDAVSQAREVGEAAVKTIQDEIGGAREYVDKFPDNLIAHPERLESFYAMIDATLGLSMPGRCSKCLLDIRAALADVHMVLREMGGTIVYGHSRVKARLDLAEIKCAAALKQLRDLDTEHQDAVYLSRRATMK